MAIEYRPLTPERWADFETLFVEKRGALPPDENLAGGGCWCMEFRRPPKDFLFKANENHDLMKGIVDSGEPTGILAYEGDEPVGWCSVAPRRQCVGLDYRAHLRPVETPDDRVWSIVCFFVARQARGRGVMRGLLEAAIAFARERGARILEAYPLREDPKDDLASGFRGVLRTLERQGFATAVERFPGEPIVRLALD
jgi:GNAT superfamily N-acetyltransferase